MTSVMTALGDHRVTWSSDHVFIPPGPMSDLFLLQIVLPFLRNLPGLRKWFFIRYGEGGPHLRIRVDVESAGVADVIHRRWRDAAPAYLDEIVLGPEWQGRGEPMLKRGSVQSIEYVPEHERYGGSGVMAANEQLFCKSTMLALGIIAATAKDFERRVGQAAGIMIATACALTDDPRAREAFFRDYADGWRRFLTPFGWNPDVQPVRLHDPETIREKLRNPYSRERSYSSVWRAHIDDLIVELNAVRNSPLTNRIESIVQSQLHMFCNRLGISPSIEFHIASQISSLL